MCECKNVKAQTQFCYDQMIRLRPPKHMAGYMRRRQAAGLNKDGKIGIDPCVVGEISELWNQGITTYGCCCGHNSGQPFVNVSERDIPTMIGLGYEQKHPTDKKREDTFKLESV